MKTLITPLQALKAAFGEDGWPAADAVVEADIAAAEQRYVVPVIGRALHASLLEGRHAEFRNELLAPAVALFTRYMIQPRLDIRTGQCGTTAPKNGCGEPAPESARRALRHALRIESRMLLRRAVEYLRLHSAEFPEYDPLSDLTNRCTTDGGFVQIR